MIRARFKTKESDYRPIEWPIKYPYWCTGCSGDGAYFTLVAYADDEKHVKRLWPEAYDIDSEEVDKVVFTDRFSAPDWY